MAHKDGTMTYWDLDKGEIAGDKLGGHKGGVISLDISQDGRFAISAGAADMRVKYWRLTDPPNATHRGVLVPIEKGK